MLCVRRKDATVIRISALPLGHHRGEIPVTVNFQAPANATWNFGDGASAKGQKARYTYTKPGEYVVTALFGFPIGGHAMTSLGGRLSERVGKTSD